MSEHIVKFEYCTTCKYYSKPESEDPCHDCLNDSYNVDSRKPTRWESASTSSRNQQST